MRKIILPLLSVLFMICPLVGNAQIQTAEESEGGRMRLREWVMDPGDLLSTASKTRLDSICRNLERETTAELVVVVLKTTGVRDPEADFATDLFNEMRIGKSDVDNGVLLLLVLDDHMVTIRTGQGIENVLTNAECESILHGTLEILRMSRFGAALEHAATQISARLKEPAVRARITSLSGVSKIDVESDSNF